MKIFSFFVLSVLIFSTAQGNTLKNTSYEIPPLTGGDISPEALDVRTMPFLSLPISTHEQAISKDSDYNTDGFEGEKKIDLYGIESFSGLICALTQNPILPNGFIITIANNVPNCSYPFTTGYYSIIIGGAYFNQYNYTSYYDVPVGNTMRYCSALGVPSGWQVTQTNLPASCPGSGPDSIMQHVTCVSGDTNCYPQSASISASPQTAIVPYGQTSGSTTINWNTVNFSNPCIWTQNTGGSPALWGCAGGGAHSSVWPFVPAGGTTIVWISNGGSSSPSPNIAQVVVTGKQGPAPIISASPTAVTAPAGQPWGSPTVVSFNSNGDGYSGNCVWFQNTGGAATFYGCGGATGTINWPYVPAGGSSRFWITPDSSSATPVFATVTITAQRLPSPIISASPTAVTVPAGQAWGSPTVVSFNSNGDGYSGSCIWFQNTGGAATFYGCGGATGTINWPYVPAGGSSRFWITPDSSSATPVLATVTITAN